MYKCVEVQEGQRHKHKRLPSGATKSTTTSANSVSLRPTGSQVGCHHADPEKAKKSREVPSLATRHLRRAYRQVAQGPATKRRPETTFLEVESHATRLTATRKESLANYSNKTWPLSRRSPGRNGATPPDRSEHDVWPKRST